MEITFIHLLNADNKELVLREVINEAAHGNAAPSLFVMQDDLFTSIDGCPLAYYAPHQMLLLSARGHVLSTKGVVARQGIGAASRFHRLVWEVPPARVGNDWLHMAHGTPPVKFYKPTTHVFLWTDDGSEAKADVLRRYPYLKGNYGFKIQAEEFYRKPGLCYGKRTEYFTVQVLPSNHVFSFEGTAIFTDETYLDNWSLLALLNSEPVRLWLSIVCAEHKAYNYVEAIPIPLNIGPVMPTLSKAAQKGWRIQRDLDAFNLTSPIFVTVALRNCVSTSLAAAARAFHQQVAMANEELMRIQNEIDDICFDLYGIRTGVTSIVNNGETPTVDDQEEDESPDTEEESTIDVGILSLSSQLFDCLLGVILGRWNILMGLDPSAISRLPDPFDPLPVCPPGMLQGPDGLPAKPEDVPFDYPIRIDWDGILVDDPGHEDDIIRRVQDVLEVIWKDRAEAIEKEACEILGVRDLRDYFRKPGNGGFWMDHVKRYSKSRRKAPIYWYMRSAKGNYGLWLYYHRLDKDIFFKALLNYVEPKIRLEEDRLRTLRGRKEAAGSSGREAKQIEKDMDRQDQLVSELHDFADKLRRAANLHLVPDLNDGVVLTIAPLFELVPWKEAKECWEDLVEGKYEWSSIGKQMREKGLVKK